MSVAIGHASASINHMRQRPLRRRQPRSRQSASDDDPAAAWGALSIA